MTELVETSHDQLAVQTSDARIWLRPLRGHPNAVAEDIRCGMLEYLLEMMRQADDRRFRLTREGGSEEQLRECRWIWQWAYQTKRVVVMQREAEWFLENRWDSCIVRGSARVGDEGGHLSISTDDDNGGPV